jgi:hypothetical protein
MAKVKLNPVMEKFRGRIGDLVFKHYGDEVMGRTKPRPKRTATHGSAIGASNAPSAGCLVRAAGDG